LINFDVNNFTIRAMQCNPPLRSAPRPRAKRFTGRRLGGQALRREGEAVDLRLCIGGLD
jgi:hypothetical protein